MKKMKTQQKSRIFDLHILEIVCNVAVPSMLQQSMVSTGFFWYSDWSMVTGKP